MSDGLSDAHADERMACDFNTALYDLGEALRRIKEGNRGWTIGVDIIKANEHLRGTGFKLIRNPFDR